ncbi:uncharacterized protein DDB_G0284459-like [Anopheles bellator]|uniref:uncharacterized protein DDB_G0284459-like n=1 Tax=Anopheles bellator TaxID=139047 RepID=UPI00264711B6|nr:uncharacterized protein DDB_G0284459-like [Anopheles bellator]
MDDFDIYGDLDKCDAEAEKKSREVQSLLCRIAELEQQVKTEEQQKCEVLNKNNILLENISSLLLTAKAELKRKDTIISDLRKQCDNALFRRGNHITRDRSSNRASNSHNRGTQTVSVQSKHVGVQVELVMEDDYLDRKRKCVRGHEEGENHRRERERNREQDRRCEKYRDHDSDREKDRGKDREWIRDTSRGRDRENTSNRHSDKHRARDSEKERDREKYAQLSSVWGRDQRGKSRDRHRDRDDFSMQSRSGRNQRSSERDHQREGKYRDRNSIVFSNSTGTHPTRDDIKVLAGEKRALESNSKESITHEKKRRKEKSSTLLVQNEMHKTSSHRDICTNLEDVHVKKEHNIECAETDAKSKELTELV